VSDRSSQSGWDIRGKASDPSGHWGWDLTGRISDPSDQWSWDLPTPEPRDPAWDRRRTSTKVRDRGRLIAAALKKAQPPQMTSDVLSCSPSPAPRSPASALLRPGGGLSAGSSWVSF
jgi:hypothetical protein